MSLSELWGFVVAASSLALSVATSGHAILYKREPRAALGWVGLSWLVPFVGPVLYLLFGINRIRRKAQILRPEQSHLRAADELSPEQRDSLRSRLIREAGHLETLVRFMDGIADRPLLAGNNVTILRDGDGAYPAMLDAINAAERSVALCTYIFDNDHAGRAFLDALAAARDRGVQIRVLIDDVGSRYSWPPMVRLLRRARIPVTTFIPTRVPGRFRYANLRNHRKILVVDGRIGFTGGINIREGSWLRLQPSHAVQDLHFRFDGPVVRQLQSVFADDWAFSAGEVLDGDPWFPRLESCGATFARGIPDGPDADFEKIRMTLLGAASCAQSSIQIITPYFLPDSSLITALNVAAMRGLDVDIVLPQENNLKLVQWASTAMLWQVLERGCRVWLGAPPFDHSKLMLVDGRWALIGSANWDPRSLRLNFEFNVESYNRDLADSLQQLMDEKIGNAIPVTLHDVDSRSLPIRLRDGIARLAMPYL